MSIGLAEQFISPLPESALGENFRDAANRPAHELGVIYDEFAPKLIKYINPNKLLELLEDLQFVDQFGYLVYDDFITSEGIQRFSGPSSEIDEDITWEMRKMFGLLSAYSTKNSSLNRTGDLIPIPLRKKKTHIDVGDGHTFLINFIPNSERNMFNYKFWPFRYDDRSDQLYGCNEVRDWTSRNNLDLFDSLEDRNVCESIMIKSGQLVVIGGSSLGQFDTDLFSSLPHSVESNHETSNRLRLMYYNS